METNRGTVSSVPPHKVPADAENYCAVVASLRVDDTFPALDQPRELLEQQMFAMTARFQEAAIKAPSAIAADVKAFTATYGQVVDALRGVNYDASRLAPEDVEALSSPELQGTLQRISAYDKRVCG